jgi:hypothetical protein
MNSAPLCWKWALSRLVCCIALIIMPGSLGAQTSPPTQAATKKSATASSKPREAAEQKPVAAAKPNPASPAREPIKLQIFRMERHDPERVVLAAQYLMQGQGNGGMSENGFGGFGGLGGLVQGMYGGGFGIMGFGGIAAGPSPNPGSGMILGGGGGGFPGGGTIIAISSSTVGQTRFVTDPRGKNLIARGPARDLQIVSDLVEVFNNSDPTRIAKAKGFHVFKIEYANPEDVALAVTQLHIGAKVAPIIGSGRSSEEKLKLVIARGTDEQIREIQRIVDAMDVRTEAEKLEDG